MNYLFFWKKNRAKTPTVIQMEFTECGAAALSIILGYYGCYVPMEELRVKCGVSRNGSNAFDMIQAAKSFGMEAAGYSIDFENMHELELPAILHWDNNHFVILEGIKKNKVFINNPAFGPTKITSEELKRRFSGVAIEFKPSPDFKKQGSPRSLFGAIKERVLPFKDALFYTFVIQLVLVLIGFSQPVFIQLFLDKILGQSILSWKKEFLSFFLLIIALTGLMTWMQGRFLNFTQIRLGIRYSTDFLWHTLRLPLSFFSQRFGGEIIHRMSLNNRVAEVLNGEVMLTVLNLILINVYTVIMFQYDVPIALVGIATACLNFILLVSLSRARVNAYARVQQEDAKAYGVSLEALRNIETIKAFGIDNFFFSRIAGYYTKNINALQEIGKKDAWLQVTASLLQQAASVFLLGFGVWRVMHGNLSIGMLFALQALMNMFLKPFDQLIGFGAQIQTLRIDLNRLDDVLQNEEDPLVAERSGTVHPPDSKLEGNLEFRQVSYGYNPIEKPFIDNFNFSLSKGEWLGLTGGVGSGKSTIAKLAANLFGPVAGQILYDGHAALDYSREILKHSIACVDQTIYLFSGTIKENLTLWDSSIDNDVVIAAAKDACIHDEIITFPHGYQTVLEEDGRNLSHGQRQRLEIARALLSNPSFLILDEATSAIDSKTEEDILKNIRKKNITCLLVAHRLSTVQNCKEIIVLEKGLVLERGSHEQLKKNGGLYQKLLESAALS